MFLYEKKSMLKLGIPDMITKKNSIEYKPFKELMQVHQHQQRVNPSTPAIYSLTLCQLQCWHS